MLKKTIPPNKEEKTSETTAEVTTKVENETTAEVTTKVENETTAEVTTEVTTEVETELEEILNKCVYENHQCTVCGYVMCIDEDNDTYCDVCGLKYEYIDDNTCRISKIGNYTGTTVDIPKYIGSHKVVEIGKSAFSSCYNLTNIIIPESIANIGDKAFLNCYQLTNIAIPDSVISIGDEAFFGCFNITSIIIPKNVTNIGKRVLAVDIISSSILAGVGGSKLQELIVDINNPNYYSEGNCIIEKSTDTVILGCKTSIIPSTVTNIGAYAFYNCSGLKSITIPDGVTNIGEFAFYRCTELTSITLPDSVIDIEELAFYGCFKVRSIYVPSSVTHIGDGALACGSNQSLTITIDANNTNYYIDENCIIEKSTNALLAVYNNAMIPSNVTSIGNYAFNNRNDITSIIIPDEVTSIGDNAFHGCSKLTSITIPGGLTNIGSNALFYCENLQNIHFNGTTEQWNNISFGYDWDSGTGEYTVYCTDSEITKN